MKTRVKSDIIALSNKKVIKMAEKETKIYIVRHGQSVGNLTRTILGHTDLDLTDLGREQAQACARFLSEIRFDKIYSSDLLRALSTAKPHADMRNMPIRWVFTLSGSLPVGFVRERLGMSR